jgi:flagellar hook assembly protein FlgD
MSYKYITLPLIILAIFLSICLIYANQIINPAGVYIDQTRNTTGTLTFTVRTVTYNGGYAPHNVGAIWITNSTNQFVKTVKIWAQSHRDDVVRWLANSGNNTVGAVTSATLSNHQLHTVTWNGTNVSGAQVADGDYKVNVEFAEHEASSSNMGKYSVHTFTKGPANIDQTIPNETYFQNMHLVWVYVPVGNNDESDTPLLPMLNQNYPNPFNKNTNIRYYLDKSSQAIVNIYDVKGRLVKKLADGIVASGWHELTWDGKDSKGAMLPSGKYICRLQTSGKVMTRTISLVH